MRLHLDGIVFSLQQHGGITVYFRELLRRFSEADDVTLTVESPLRQVITGESFPGVRIVDRKGRLLERVRACRTVNDTEGMHPDVFHSSYYRRPAVHRQPTVVTVHDFVAHRFLKDWRGLMRRQLMVRAIEQANHIICISEATRQDLLEFVHVRKDQRVSVIHNGVADTFQPVPADQAQLTPDQRPFALFVGQRGGYKNFSLAIEALERLPELALYCVGGGSLRPEETSGMSERTRANVRHLGFVSDDQLNVLYNQAHCLLYPSAYEGFGIPVVEAMRAGCPVVSINCKAVVEVGGKALTVSSSDTDAASLALAVERLNDSEHRESVRKQGLERSQQFSWDHCYKQTMEVYRGM